jgi:hypothetical protein
MGFIGLDTIVWIRKNGLHYHLLTCWMVKDPNMTDDPYYGIEFKELDKKKYKPCACIMEYELGRRNKR